MNKPALVIDSKLKDRFPGLEIVDSELYGIAVKKELRIEKLSLETIRETKTKYNLETLKDLPVFRAYRTFFWRLGIDPTKVRPAAEALRRRILLGKEIPKINNVVDCYNLASIKTGISIGAFDLDKLKGELKLRFAELGEKFLGIGFEHELELKGNELVVADSEKIIAIYPYRDAEHTKVTEHTKNIYLLFCGAPGIELKELLKARALTLEYLTKYCKQA